MSPAIDQIKTARKQAGLTQAEAARLVGSPSYRTWQDWERGARPMPSAVWELFQLKTAQAMQAGSARSGQMVRPVLKWAGGKYRLLGRILGLLEPHGRLIEPFAGSAVVSLNSPHSQVWLADSNPHLMAVYAQLQQHTDAFIAACARWFQPQYNQESAYYQVRHAFNVSLDPVAQAAMFVYLNRHGYNGLCRYNRKGEFNTPFGRYRAPYFPETEMRLMAQRLQQARLSTADFRVLLAQAGPGDVVYCDPPYLPRTSTANFTDYAQAGFALSEHQALAEAARAAAARGAQVLISNHDLPLTRELYHGAELSLFQVGRSISCVGSERRAVPELLALFPAATGRG